jgi:hypothetical protein
LDQAANVKVEIYNVLGERVAEIAEARQAGPGQTFVWDCQAAAAGIYFARIQVDGQEFDKKKIAITK